MKNIFSKIKKKLHNSGSGLILVIVALAFVGILAGALLTAVAYVYRLKLYDYNAKSNFYYLEQAMDEMYAGVGTRTMTDMQEAYQETREKVVYYDVKSKSYKNIGNEKANKLFKDAFMAKIAEEDFYNIAYDIHGDIDPDSGLIKELKSLISNESVTLVPDNMKVIKYDENGEQYVSNTQVLAKVVIKNVTLQRTAEYNRSQANGTFTQTISTDIEISRPDFEVNFNSNNLDIDNLFSFCLIADSGIEINEDLGSKLTINGNVYGGSDFYNKTYNRYDDAASNKITKDKFELVMANSDGTSNTTEYTMSKVYNRTGGSGASSDLINENYRVNVSSANRDDYLYNGDNQHSKYSGLYIDGADVSILAKYVIVPGSISLMNAGDLTIYGRDGSAVSESNIWTDEFVLAGYVPKSANSTGAYTENKGANAFLDANLYVKDDTQIESDSANLKLSGGYYGYSNSSTADDRLFVPTTKKDSSGHYVYEQVVNSLTGKTENRGHYNSSSILVNSKNATIDMSTLSTLYIAGRSYIELSHQKNGSTTATNEMYTVTDNDYLDSDGNPTKTTYQINKSSNTYEYDSTVDDYRTGESVSIRSSQLAYTPDNFPYAVNEDRQKVANPVEDNPNTTANEKNYDHYECEVDSTLGSSYLFRKYFGEGGSQTVTSIPVIYTKDTVTNNNGTTSEKNMYYIDFDYISEKRLYDTRHWAYTPQRGTGGKIFQDGSGNYFKFEPKDTANYSKYGDYLKKCFIQDYFDYLNYAEDWNNSITVNIPQHLESGVTVYDVDTDILEDDDLSDLLKEVTHYDDHIAGQITIPDLDDSNVYSYTSGVITNTGERLFDVNDNNEYLVNPNNPNSEKKEVSFKVITSKNSVIDSTLEGSTSKFNTTKIDATIDNDSTSTYVNGTTFSNEYEKHYNYVKWALMDLDSTTEEAKIVDQIVAANGEGCITPLNRYLSFVHKDKDSGEYEDTISASDPLMNFSTGTASHTNISPSNLDLGDYSVWMSDEDVYIESDKETSNHTVTGIVISKGDVYFPTLDELKRRHPDWSDAECKNALVTTFNGLVISGGKIYINNNVTSINATDICKNIINTCFTIASNTGTKDGTPEQISKARDHGARAIRFLSVFKAYENEAYSALDEANKSINEIDSDDDEEEEKENEDSPLSISNIDYSDVIRYNNWMRNVD